MNKPHLNSGQWNRTPFELLAESYCYYVNRKQALSINSKIWQSVGNPYILKAEGFNSK